MSEISEVIISDCILDEMRCPTCNNYLSSAPLRLLPNGQTICGHCSPTTPSQTGYRNLNLETILSKVDFPCKYRENGCEIRLLFDRVHEHESKCYYRKFTCPCLPNGSCSWEGLQGDMFVHFRHCHSDLLVDNFEFELELDEDKQGILMGAEDCFTLILKYRFDPELGKLFYDVRYFSYELEEDTSWPSCKLHLQNCLDRDYCVSIKANRCLLYDMDFYGVEGSQVVLSDVLSVLDRPTRVAVVFDVLINRSKENIKIDSVFESFERFLGSVFKIFAVVGVFIILLGVVALKWTPDQEPLPPPPPPPEKLADDYVVFFIIIVILAFAAVCGCIK